MSLKFIEQPPHTTKTQITTTTWTAQPEPNEVFNVVRITKQDLINAQRGQTNFFGHEKPKLGTLEEKTDVFMASWVYMVEGNTNPHVRPLVGNFMGGFATHREAVQMCNDVWQKRWRYRSKIIRVPQAGMLN